MLKTGNKSKPYKFTESTPLNVEETMVQYQRMYSNPVALLSNSKKGLNAQVALDFLTISGFTYDEFQNTFKTTVKTIQNYNTQDLKLDASLSEKLLKSFSLFKLGIEVFGSAPAFHSWLNTAAYGLGNQIPFTLMDTFTGLSLIEEELTRIAHGDLA
ncbi:type II RES/Xre toxin-antitoxin system antitoxin [Pedobacter jejuensis]|uniref:DUF2384 domain-containing protein n=1 Tax=Pedobacter jejuensis TaxID=1268550 RepID=A0A3N0BYL3_9SPHI|nr:MbcA/ParS/Xre antitoxin family protein [Pedobacter jejuensis]RNL54925.1 DUF2384 domain-containing protein [Pedobacter jejuensis]